MKRIRSGFTLAEVLITLGVIGVVSAIVMPAVMTNYTYKTVGVKLSKFMSQLENAARPYVVQNQGFVDETESVVAFVQEAFLITNMSELTTTTVDCSEEDLSESDRALCGIDTTSEIQYFSNLVSDTDQIADPTATEGTRLAAGQDIVKLKDGTMFQLYLLGAEGLSDRMGADVNVNQVGVPVFGIAFDPSVNGLPKAVNKAYKFIVTELGYVYPDRSDECLSQIYDADFLTNSKTFGANSACVASLTSGGGE